MRYLGGGCVFRSLSLHKGGVLEEVHIPVLLRLVIVGPIVVAELLRNGSGIGETSGNLHSR